MDINANTEIWQFFSKFDKNGMIDNLSFEDFQRTISVTPNQFNDYFIIAGVENYMIYTEE